jgi:hypothetical protein
METLFEIFVEFFLEVFLEVVIEFALVFGGESLAATVRKRREVDPLLARFGYLLIGLSLGAISGFVFPNRLFRSVLPALLTLVVNPLLAGWSASYYGKIRRAMGHPTTHLATFFGGAALALGVSVARVCVVLWW